MAANSEVVFYLKPPTILAPADSVINVSISPIFQWQSSLLATHYHLQISIDPTFSPYSIVKEYNNISGTSISVDSLDYFTEYRWRIRSMNASDSSEWSPIYYFVTEMAPLLPPIHEIPDNFAINIPKNPTIRWYHVNLATGYHFQLATDSLFTNITLELFQTSRFIITSNLNYSTTYYWRVRTIGYNDTRAWSQFWRFTTVNQISAPSLEYPLNFSTGVSVNPTLIWNSVPTADEYLLQVADNSNFDTLIVNVNTNDTLYQIQSLNYMTTYYWRLKSINQVDTSLWSTVWSFTTTSMYTTQNFSLQNGWNMISANVEPPTQNIETLMLPLLGNLQILRNYAGQTYIPPIINTINTWNKYHAYQLRMANVQQLDFSGVQIVPENTPITLNMLGWYWLPYYRTSPMPVGTALATISGKYLQVKTITGNIYMPPFANTLTSLEPGKGYMIRMIQDNGVLTYPANGIIKGSSSSRTFAEPKVFVRPNVSTGKNAFIVMDIELRDGDELGVFTRDGLLIGGSVWQEGLRGVVVWGDDEFTNEKDGAAEGDELVFKVWSNGSGKLGNIYITETCDMVSGSRKYYSNYETDAVIILRGTVSLDKDDVVITPQPATTELYITLGSMSSEDVSVDFYNQSGCLMLRERNRATDGVLKFNVSELPSGIYNVVIRAETQVFSRRILIFR